jgi:hypothetical protein
MTSSVAALIGISGLGEGPYRTAEAAAAAGYSSIGGASAVREELIGKELIWSPRRGLIDFTVTRFAQCLRVTHAPGHHMDPMGNSTE